MNMRILKSAKSLFAAGAAVVFLGTAALASGVFAPGFPTQTAPTGNETIPMDTQNAAGQYPESVGITVQQLAREIEWLAGNVSTATVAGTEYYGSISIGAPTQLTGIRVKVGATGGTDTWIVALANSSGVVLATSTLSGTTAGTANTFQSIAFTTPFNVPSAGTYFVILQSNGTTAAFDSYNSSGSPMLTGSQTGTAGTIAAITTVPTTFTALKGPVSVLY